MPLHLFPALFAVAAVSGWIDAVAGSGGLLQLPALLLLGGAVPVPALPGMLGKDGMQPLTPRPQAPGATRQSR